MADSTALVPRPEWAGDGSILNVVACALEADRRGLPTDELLARIDVRRSALFNPARRLRRSDSLRMIELCCAASGDIFFHVAAFMNAPIGQLGPIDWVMTMSPTLRDGGRRCSRAIALADSGIRVEFAEEGPEAPAMFVRAVFEPRPHYGDVEGLVGATIRCIRLASGQGAERVTLNVPCRGEVPRIEALMGCPVEYRPEAAHSILHMRKDTLDEPTLNAHPAVAQLISVPMVATTTFGDRVVDVLVGGIPFRRAALRWVADSLGMTEKGLRKKLHLEGLTFRQLLGRARERIRTQLLDHGSLKRREIAGFLGRRSPSDG